MYIDPVMVSGLVTPSFVIWTARNLINVYLGFITLLSGPPMHDRTRRLIMAVDSINLCCTSWRTTIHRLESAISFGHIGSPTWCSLAAKLAQQWSGNHLQLNTAFWMQTLRQCTYYMITHEPIYSARLRSPPKKTYIKNAHFHHVLLIKKQSKDCGVNLRVGRTMLCERMDAIAIVPVYQV